MWFFDHRRQRRIDCAGLSAERTDQPNRFNLKAYNVSISQRSQRAGYVLDDVMINGEKMLLLVSAGSSFRIPEIVKDHSVEIRFVRDCSGSRSRRPLSHIRLSRRFCSVRALFRRLARSYNEGANQQPQSPPTAGVVQNAKHVDGAPVACNQAGCTHTFTDVRSDHSLEVICS